jgi:hypothetical protein
MVYKTADLPFEISYTMSFAADETSGAVLENQRDRVRADGEGFGDAVMVQDAFGLEHEVFGVTLLLAGVIVNLTIRRTITGPILRVVHAHTWTNL